jgi:LPXTG-motif cell wall-anchored protein
MIFPNSNLCGSLLRPSRYSLLLALFLFMIALPASAEEPGSFRISQAVARLPQITAWLEVLTSRDQFVSDVAPNQLTASIGVRPARIVSVTPFSDSGEGIAGVLLVDISKSLKPVQFEKMREALLAWVDTMTEKDRTAITTFGTEVHQVLNFSADRAALKDAIGRLKPTDTYTQLHRGLVEAMAIKNRMDLDIPLHRVIVTLSDGRDDYAAGLRREEVLAAMQADRIPLYAIGFSPPPATPQKEEDLKKLGEFARASGGMLLKAGNTPFSEMIAQLRERVQQVQIAQVICDTCEADNALHRLQINLTAGQRAFTDGLNVRLIRVAGVEPSESQSPAQDAPAVTPAPPDSARWPYLAGGGLALLALIAGLVLWRRRKKTTDIRPDSHSLQAGEAVGNTPDNEFTREEEMSSAIQSSFCENDTRPLDDAQIADRLADRQFVPGLRLRLTPIGVHPSFSACEVVLVDRLVLGRVSNQCAVHIPGDEKISRQHCELIRKDETLLVRDLDTTNGTRVNGVQISGVCRLESDDILLLGRTELRISIMPPA